MRIVPRDWPMEVPVPPPIPKRYFDDEWWISEHMHDLQQCYPDRWVAVVNGEVAAAGEVPADVERLAEEKTGEREFPVWFIQPESGYHSHCRVL